MSHCAENDLAIQKQYALQKRTSQNLILIIGLIIVGVVDDLIAADALAHQLRRHLQRLRSCAGMAKYAGVMHNTHVKRFCRLLRNLRLIEQARYDLRSRAGIRTDIIDICITDIADVVVDADRMLRILQKRQRTAKPLLIRTVQRDKKVMWHVYLKYL